MSDDGARLVVAIAFVGRGRQRNRFIMPTRYALLIDGRERAPAAKRAVRRKRRGKGGAKARRLLREAIARDSAKPNLQRRRRAQAAMISIGQSSGTSAKKPSVVLRIASADGRTRIFAEPGTNAKIRSTPDLLDKSTAPIDSRRAKKQSVQS